MENVFGILMGRFRVLLDKMNQRPEAGRDFVLTWVDLHDMLRSHQGRANRAPTPADDVAALQNEQVVYVPDNNYRNPLKETKHQQDLLKHYFNHHDDLAGQENRT